MGQFTTVESVILNGLLSGEHAGQFTYWSGLKHLAIDYILIYQYFCDDPNGFRLI